MTHANAAWFGAVHRQVEQILWTMVAEGAAELSGVGPHGPTFVAPCEAVIARAEALGLVDHHAAPLIVALVRLRREPEAVG